VPFSSHCPTTPSAAVVPHHDEMSWQIPKGLDCDSPFQGLRLEKMVGMVGLEVWLQREMERNGPRKS